MNVALTDRLYGAIEIPPLVRQLALSCPAILRLREVRQPNIPFVTYPSFADVSRYEHSVGVAHLAWRWCSSNGLHEEEALAVTIAALYHDAGTPALGHLFEEFLARYDFDHELAISQLIRGSSGWQIGGRHAQVFAGRHCLLPEVLPPPDSSDGWLTLERIAEIISGGTLYGPLIKGPIDLDNVDNVLRAVTAMGIATSNWPHPYDIVDSLVIDDGEIKVVGDRSPMIRWLEMRSLLYTKILSNPYEFRAQAAMKWAIQEAAKQLPTLADVRSWSLTDSELVFQHLLRGGFSAHLVNRVRLGRPPDLLFSAWFNDLSAVRGPAGSSRLDRLAARLSEATRMEVSLNFYLDKRRRRLTLADSRREPFIQSHPRLNHFDHRVPSGSGGILGAIAVTQAERAAADPAFAALRPPGPPMPLSLETLDSVLEAEAGLEADGVSLGWIEPPASGNLLRVRHYALPLT